MSEYRAISSAAMAHHWEIIAPDGRTVDVLRTVAGAAYAARLLNAAMARVNPHAVIGCRVEIVNGTEHR